MKVEVKVVSKEIIKPSSPTPDHLRSHLFSFLDQRAPPFYSSFVTFYEFNGDKKPNLSEISNHLKASLADVLTLYYPLAGRVNNNLYVDCKDQGVPFLEASVNNCKLSDILRNPDPGVLTKLVPFELEDSDIRVPLGVQLNIFGCGGFTIGQCVSHKIADGLSMLMFTRAWAANSRLALGDKHAKVERPLFVSSTLFPPKLDMKQSDTYWGVTGDRVTKRVVFDSSNIEDLREKYEGIQRNKKIRPPSVVQTLSAFISSRFAACTNQDSDIDHQKFHMTLLPVNLRPRFDPPLPSHAFGNLTGGAATTPLLLSTRKESYGLARRVHDAINAIDESYLKNLQQGVDHTRDSVLSRGDVVRTLCTSVCGFPLYNTDFGWGRPSWVTAGLPGSKFNNVVLFLDNRESNGIEAYISSTKQVWAKLESDTEFLTRVSPGCSTLSSAPRPRQYAKISTGNPPSKIRIPNAWHHKSCGGFWFR